jgi:hypothetical protein
MRRFIPHLVLLALLVRTNNAPADDARSAQVAAATAGALLRLQDDIGDERLSPRLTVKQFLEQTGRTPQLLELLRRADQIGGPRWLDDQTCQVKLSVSGQRVEKLLENIAADLGPKSPIPAAAIRIKLRDWNGRSFLATGASISASKLEVLRPTDSLAWQPIDDASRRRAVTDAAQDAARRIIESVRTLPIGPNQSGGDLLADKAIADQFNQWLATRPVTNVRFYDDLSVELTLGVTGDDVFDKLHTMPGPSPNVKVLNMAERLSEARRAFEAQFESPVGRGRVNVSSSAPSPPRMSLDIPSQPPDWVKNPIRSEARSSSKGSKLKTARAAEGKAMENLRAEVDSLTLDGKLTLAEAAKRSPAIAQAIGSAMSRARIAKVDYLSGGDANVKVELDPRDLWDELSRLP